MFQVNDVVIYGHHGVCEITEIGKLKMPMADQEKLYYTLRPVYHKESAVYAPVENRKIIMRSVITKEEAEEYVMLSGAKGFVATAKVEWEEQL